MLEQKVSSIYIYSCYVPPSLSLEEYEKVLDNLVEMSKQLQQLV